MDKAGSVGQILVARWHSWCYPCRRYGIILQIVTRRLLLQFHIIELQENKILLLPREKVFHLGANPIHPGILHRYIIDPKESKGRFQFPYERSLSALASQSLVIFFIK